MAIIEVGQSGQSNQLGAFYGFLKNNPFYLLAPPYYMPFYSQYLRFMLRIYDGYDPTYHNFGKGLVPEKLAQSVAKGLCNVLFAHGIDFVGKEYDTKFARDWAEKTNLLSVLRKAFLYSAAGGTSLLAATRNGNNIGAAAYRIDTFFADFNAMGKVEGARVYFDLFHDTENDKDNHYGICEERYFNERGIPCVKRAIYCVNGNIQSDVSSRPKSAEESIPWEQLPRAVKRHIKENYPDILIGKEQYLPFADSVGLFPVKFTDGIPKLPNTPFGQPIGDIISSECQQFDQLKCFEKNEVYVAKGRILMPEQMMNKDDPAQTMGDFDETLFQKVGSNGTDTDKPTDIQFKLRASDIRVQKENIYRDVAAKLNVSASTIASFLTDGSTETVAAAILNEKNKTSAWIPTQIALIAPAINALLAKVMRYYDHEPVKIIFKSQAQAPTLENAKIYMDMYSAGGISAKLFVDLVFPELSEEEKAYEIKRLEENEKIKKAQLTNGIQ